MLSPWFINTSSSEVTEAVDVRPWTISVNCPIEMSGFVPSDPLSCDRLTSSCFLCAGFLPFFFPLPKEPRRPRILFLKGDNPPSLSLKNPSSQTSLVRTPESEEPLS